MKRSTPRGFTLLELLMVLAVIVVVMSIAAPALQDVLFAQHIKMAGEQLRTDFGRARIMAMKSGRIVSFRFRPDSGAYVIQAVYGSTDDTEIAMDEALGEAIPVIEEELPENIVFQTLAGEANSRDAFVQESLQTNSDAAVLAMSPRFFSTRTAPHRPRKC